MCNQPNPLSLDTRLILNAFNVNYTESTRHVWPWRLDYKSLYLHEVEYIHFYILAEAWKYLAPFQEYHQILV